MSNHITLSVEQQRIVTQLAQAHGKTPEQWLDALIDAAWEQECAQYDAAFENDPEWLAGTQEAVSEAEAGNSRFFPSTEAFMQHLRACGSEADATSGPREPQPGPEHADARWSSTLLA